jgi:anaerobic selenocysteine-containing dehydrogenase
MPLEVPATTQVPLDTMTLLGNGYGLAEAFAQYTAAVATVPSDSDLVADWEVFWGLAERLDVPLTVRQLSVFPVAPIELLPGPKPTDDELLERLATGSRVPLATVRDHEHGAWFGDDSIRVEAGDDDGQERLRVNDPTMMADLASYASRMSQHHGGGLRLIGRRIQQAYNSSYRHEMTLRGRPFNPAFLHSSDLERHGLSPGDEVVLRTAAGAVRAVVDVDDNLLPGVVSMTHCFGGLPGDSDDPHDDGSSTSRLVDLDDRQPYSGQPIMGNIPVDLERLRR